MSEPTVSAYVYNAAGQRFKIGSAPGVGIPPGGVDGDHLVKLGTEHYVAEWETPAAEPTHDVLAGAGLEGGGTLGPSVSLWVDAGEAIDTANGVSVKVDAVTIEIAADALQVKDAGITAAKINAKLDALSDVTDPGPAAAGTILTADGLGVWSPQPPASLVNVLPDLLDVSDALAPVTWDSASGSWASEPLPPAPPPLTLGVARTQIALGINEAYVIATVNYSSAVEFALSGTSNDGTAFQVATGVCTTRIQPGVGYFGTITLSTRVDVGAKLFSKLGLARHPNDQAPFTLYFRSSASRTLESAGARAWDITDAVPVTRNFEYSVPVSGVVEIDL
jgi:hypothetical protein